MVTAIKSSQSKSQNENQDSVPLFRSICPLEISRTFSHLRPAEFATLKLLSLRLLFYLLHSLRPSNPLLPIIFCPSHYHCIRSAKVKAESRLLWPTKEKDAGFLPRMGKTLVGKPVDSPREPLAGAPDTGHLSIYPSFPTIVSAYQRMISDPGPGVQVREWGESGN